MRIYDVYYGTKLYATVCVQDDGQKIWTPNPEWGDFWLEDDNQKAIEKTIDNPNISDFTFEKLTIKQRPLKS